MQFQCPKCKAILGSDEVTEGMEVVCPECGASIKCHQYAKKVILRKVATTDESDKSGENV